MGDIDSYKWSFDSTASPIQVIALTQEEFDGFFNIYVSDFTATLESPTYRGSGEWRPPYTDTWHILYYNVGSYYTQLTLTESVETGKYFQWELVIIGSILGVIVIITIIGLSIGHTKKKREEYIEERVKQLTVVKHEQPNEESLESIDYTQEDRAIEKLSNIAKKNPYKPEPWIQLANIFKKQEKYRDAIETLDYIIKKTVISNKEKADFFLQKAGIYQITGDNDLAAKFCKKTLSIDKTNQKAKELLNRLPF